MRHEWSAKSVRGQLNVRECIHHQLNRSTKIATILDDNNVPVPGLEPLIDAVLLAPPHGWWSMSGYERQELPAGGTRDFAQSWVLCPVD